MAISPEEKQKLRNALTDDNLGYRHQQFVQFVVDGMKTGGVDRMEYRTYVDMTQKKDVFALAHALLVGALSYQEYMAKMEMIIGWDLMLNGIFDGQVKTDNDGKEVTS